MSKTWQKAPKDFWIACLNGNIQKVKEYLDQGLSLDPDITGDMSAVFSETLDERQFEVLELLLDYGYKDYPENLAEFHDELDSAMLSEVEQCIEFHMTPSIEVQRTDFLIKHGANVNSLDWDDVSVLDYALKYHPKAADLLLQAGAKRSSEMTHEEKVLNHDFKYVCKHYSVADVKFYLKHKTVTPDQLFDGFKSSIFMTRLHDIFPNWDVAEYLFSIGVQIEPYSIFAPFVYNLS